MGPNFTNQIRNSLRRGCYVLKHRASARLAPVRLGILSPAAAVSCCSLCSRAMAHRVTVQPLTEKRKIPWRLLKIEHQLLPPISFPPRAGGRRTFFVGFCRRATPACKTPYFFLPLPNGVCAVGEGTGEGAKATAHKGSSIAVELPDARLNNDRTFSFLNDVHQHMTSPRKIESREP